MRPPSSTLEEAREARLRAGRRADRWTRGLAWVGGAIVLALGTVAAGNPGRAILVPWDDAAPAFRQTLPGGPTVEARQTVVASATPPAFEFRIDGAPAGTVVGQSLRGTRAERGPERRIVVRLPAGSLPAQRSVEADGWTALYRVAP